MLRHYSMGEIMSRSVEIARTTRAAAGEGLHRRAAARAVRRLRWIAIVCKRQMIASRSARLLKWMPLDTRRQPDGLEPDHQGDESRARDHRLPPRSCWRDRPAARRAGASRRRRPPPPERWADQVVGSGTTAMAGRRRRAGGSTPTCRRRRVAAACASGCPDAGRTRRWPRPSACSPRVRSARQRPVRAGRSRRDRRARRLQPIDWYLDPVAAPAISRRACRTTTGICRDASGERRHQVPVGARRDASTG